MPGEVLSPAASADWQEATKSPTPARLPSPGHDHVQVLLEQSASTLLGPAPPSGRGDEMFLTALTDEQVLFPVRDRGHCWDLLHKAVAAAQLRLMPVPTAPLAVSALVAADLRVSVVLESSRSRARGMWLSCRCPVSITG